MDRRRLAVAAEGAYSRAIERRGAIYDPDQRHRPAFAKVGTLAAKVGGRTGTPAEHLLSAWAERYVDGGRSRRPDWWLEKVEAWVSVDGAAPEAGSAVAVVLDLRGKLAALKAQIDEARDYEQLEKLRAERRGVAAQIRAAEGRA